MWPAGRTLPRHALGSHFRYIPITRCSVIGTRGSLYQYIPRYHYVLGFFDGTKEWSGSCYWNSVPITRYVVCADKFCTDSESDMRDLIIGTIPIMRP
jgi:hypothetical protein